jgi:predicted alpha/beta superfamily hydrolase
MRNLTLYLVFILVILSNDVKAQSLMSYQQPKDYEMPAKLIPTVRKYWVSLPKNYDKSTNRYSILFLFDGNEDYLKNLVLNTADQLTHFGGMPPCIIVGLVQRNRGLDFGPMYALKGFPNSDKVNGDKFLQFLKTELLPELNKNFRTQNFRIGIGHSLGGLFLTHSFTTDPDFFNGIIAISPALELKRDSILFENLKHTLSLKLNRPTSYCWASGTEGVNEVAFRPGSVALSKLVSNTPNPSFTYKYIDLPGKNHNFTPLYSITDALTFMFREWNIAPWYKALWNNEVEPEATLSARKKLLKKVYDFDTEPNEDWVLGNIGSQLLQQKKYDKALSYIKAAIQINPNNADFYRELSKTYEALKNYDLALTNIKLGIEKLDKTNEEYRFVLEEYQKDLKRVEAIVSK